MIAPELIDRFHVPAGKAIVLKDYDPSWAQTKELKELGKEVVKERAVASLHHGDSWTRSEIPEGDGRAAACYRRRSGATGE